MANGSGPDVMVTDCQDCGDDVGLTINCKGTGLPAEFVVPWAAMREGVDGAYAPVTIQIGSATYSYSAKTLHLAAIGYPPSFTVAAGDALFHALQSGKQATIRFGNTTTKISLKGAGPAIEAFKTNCGWNASTAPAPGRQMTIAAPPTRAPLELTDEQGASWSFSQRGAAATAVFGIPQTDATSVAISCDNGRAAVMEFFSAPTRDRGTRATLTLVSGEHAYALPAQANENSRLTAALDGSVGALRRAMMGSEWVQVRLDGEPAGRFLGLASATPGRRFLQACPQFGK